jgi:excisionase family DNA binding protein
VNYRYRLITHRFTGILALGWEIMSNNSIIQPSTLMQSGLFNRKQIADYLGVSERTVSNMMSRRIIPVIKFGRSVRFDPVQVHKAMTKYQIEAI